MFSHDIRRVIFSFFLIAGPIGAGLLRKLKNAVPERAEHVWNYHEFSKSLPEASISQWRALVEAWEDDGTKTNPFVITVKSIFLIS
jgi:hypothetical protein